MKRWVAVGAGVAVAAIIAVVLTMVISGNGSMPPPETPRDDVASTPAPLPTHAAPTPASTGSPSPVGGEGDELVTPFLSAEAAARENTKATVRFADVATGDALKDVEANAVALQESGLTQVGKPVIVSTEVTKLDESTAPPSATVSVCLDYSKVDMRAPDGTTVKDSSVKQRVATIMTLVEVKGSWLVSDRTFPDSPNC